MSKQHSLLTAASVLSRGGIIAYPTEAVFGLGCDPLNQQAVMRLLKLKGRPWQKGVILIAADFSQLSHFILPLSDTEREHVLASWPGPVTWLLPAQPWVPRWIRGAHDTLAVRIPEHELARELCNAYAGPIVSTSANRAGRRPFVRSLPLRCQLGSELDWIVDGEVGDRREPSRICDLKTGKVLR